MVLGLGPRQEEQECPLVIPGPELALELEELHLRELLVPQVWVLEQLVAVQLLLERLHSASPVGLLLVQPDPASCTMVMKDRMGGHGQLSLHRW